MAKQFHVYILTNMNNTVLYTGVTSDLRRRVFAHKEKRLAGFTKRYSVTKLVYFETFQDSYNAISREKQLKAGSRAKKLALIQEKNPLWEDLFDKL